MILKFTNTRRPIHAVCHEIDFVLICERLFLLCFNLQRNWHNCCMITVKLDMGNLSDPKFKVSNQIRFGVNIQTNSNPISIFFGYNITDPYSKSTELNPIWNSKLSDRHQFFYFKILYIQNTWTEPHVIYEYPTLLIIWYVNH